jgi:hypothetical protein
VNINPDFRRKRASIIQFKISNAIIYEETMFQMEIENASEAKRA